MRRTALLALAALVVLFVPTTNQASASVGYRTYGGCGFNTFSHEALTGGTYVSAIYNLSVTTRAPISTPVPATVSCKITINDVDVPDTEVSFTDLSPLTPGVQAGAAPVDLVIDDGDIVRLCQKTVYTGTGQVDDWNCYGKDWSFPPAFVYEALDYVFTDVVDPEVCSVLKQHPGTYGPITITPNGDVLGPDPLEFGLGMYFDCPPYRS